MYLAAMFPQCGRQDITTEKFLVLCYVMRDVLSIGVMWCTKYASRLLLFWVTNEPLVKEGQTWNIVHYPLGKVCTQTGMISNATIDAISTGAPPLNIVVSYHIRFGFLLYWFTLYPRKHERPLSILIYYVVGDVRFACVIKTDALIEIRNNNWSNANNAADIEEV